MKLTVNPQKADAKFVYYSFRHPAAVQMVRNRAIASGVPHINLAILKELEIPLPPVPIQRRIVSILSQYDELIENNLRRIALLEEAAQLLYQEWFVWLRFPGREHTRISNGVPDSWRKQELCGLCDVIREQVLPDRVESDTPYIGLEHMPQRSITLATWGKASEVQSAKHRFAEDDILFGKIRPYFHKVGVCVTNGVASTDAIVIRPRTRELYGLVLMTVSSDLFVAHASQSSYGAKMPRANWKVLERYTVAVPPSGLLKQFSESILDIVSLLKNLALQNQKLAAARDLLLPRLMSGEIEV